MADNVPNPAQMPPIAPESHEIVHIRDSQKRNRTLCGTKLKKLVGGQADCIVCLDILQYRLENES